MSFLKIGESFNLDASSIQSASSVLSNEDVISRFEKFATNLKKIAPKANDFLYFATNMMTSAEASIYNDDGSVKLDKSGKPIEASWEENGESMKWVCSDKSIRPYKNNNGDIFPERELIKAHKAWIGTPLCVDHKSSEVDAIRGVVLDTFYDFKTKRVVALCALDKISYPELARKVSTGYSTSVSMGTIVEKAICGADDCGRVARSEKDFCNHMKHKVGGHGEINCQLKPIELSIVVNPADPSAKIRTIFASVQKLQNHKYSSNVKERMHQLEDDIKEVQQKLVELKDISEKEEDIITEVNDDLSNDQPLITADFNVLFTELKMLKSSMEKKLEELNKKQEDIMTDMKNSMGKKGYYQGGGGVNEPTLGKPKYEVDPMSAESREEDRQMLQTEEYGGVKDEDIKGEHRPVGDRAARRKQALMNAKKNLSKSGYWLGGGGVNEPTPGKPKYEVDPGSEEARKEDKQMVGSKPFPNVGDVDEMYPGDLEKKKMVARASLKAHFVRKADLGSSGWRVFSTDANGVETPMFSASVNEISGGQVNQLGDMIATKEFGSKMLEKVREIGVEKAASLYKRAQVMPEEVAAPAASDMAAPVALAPEAAATPAEPADKDAGGSGDKKEVATELAEKVRDDASDLLEVVRDITGNQAEMGALEDGIKSLPQATAAILMPAVRMRGKLEKMIVSAAKKSLAELKQHYSELKLISEMADGEVIKNASINSMINSAFEEVKAVLADSNGVLRSYATYASGVENLQARVKKAEEKMLSSNKDKDDDMYAHDDMFGDEDDKSTHNLSDEEADRLLDEDLGDDYDTMPATVRNPKMHEMHDMDKLDLGDEMMVDDENNLEVELAPGQTEPAPGQPVPAGAVVAPKTASMDLTTKAGRAAYRAKLAADLGDPEDAASIKFNPVMDEANALANGQTQLDVKPSDDLGLVETKPELNRKMLEVAKASPKVKKEAARLNKMISEGAVKSTDLDKLIAEGLDSEVVKYWRDFYEQVDGGAEFAKMLTTASDTAKLAEEVEAYKIKLARSYELANEMARNGLITNERVSIARQVDESMKWNDDAFDSFKRVIAKRATQVKTAGTIPQVGITGSYTNTQSAFSDDLQSELDRAFSNRKY